MIEVNVLNVFSDSDGKFGNPVGIVAQDVRRLGADERQKIAAQLGFSETVFIEDAERREIRIHNPQEEIGFSGHAAVGTAWFLRNKLSITEPNLAGRDGLIEAWQEDDGSTWVRVELRTTPPWWHEYVSDVETLESLDGPPSAAQVHTQLWTWVDESQGIIRSRTFAAGWGIPEDEANGSGCMRLAAALGRSITVIHGRGSLILARSSSLGTAEAGGFVSQAPGVVV